MYTFIYWHQPDHHRAALPLGLFESLPLWYKRLLSHIMQSSPEVPLRGACTQRTVIIPTYPEVSPKPRRPR